MYGNVDWEMASKRLTAFWQKEIIDRPCLQIVTSAGKTKIENEQIESKKIENEQMENTKIDPAAVWTNPQTYFEVNRQPFANTIYLGEALPVLYPNAEHIALALGSELGYADGTIWIKKTPGSIRDLDFSHVILEHPAIQEMASYFECICQLAKDQCFVGFPHMGNPGDALARMRGYDNFCLDLLDEPERCFALEEEMLRIWQMCYDLIHGIITTYMPGSCGWLPAWHPTRSALIEFDFCALISPELFKKYIPFLVKRARHADHAIYHLDGPDALIHLDMLLAIPEIEFIQWEPGAGGGDILDWLELMQKIQAAGKGLYVSGGFHPIWKAEILLRELRWEGLMIPVYANSMDEAQRFLDRQSIVI